jgi:hypothetical protein
MKALGAIWLGLLTAMLLGFSVGYTVPKWIEHPDTVIKVVELDRKTAENLRRHIITLPTIE